MTAKEAIAIGVKIAERHSACVMEGIEKLGASPLEALRGNQVWLAAEIMKAMQEAQRALIGR